MVKKGDTTKSSTKAQAQTQAGLLEGSGIFQCFRHEFETRSIAEWNTHCSDGDHFEEGNTCCISCGERIEFSGLPFVPFKPDGSKGIQLQCDECSSAIKGKGVKITKAVKAE